MDRRRLDLVGMRMVGTHPVEGKAWRRATRYRRARRGGAASRRWRCSTR